MSGIVGLWNLDRRPVDREELGRLAATLTHRGTDGGGLTIDGAAGLGCRLSRITPEAAHEVQPLVDTSRVALVFDGRLDNREELFVALRSTTPITKDDPDPAFALAAYRAYGDNFAEHLNGDFALGLLDPARRVMVLARDAIGPRPLYYYASPTLFLFASEIKAILAHPDVRSRPADDVVADFLLNRLAEDDDRGLTFFQDIFSLLPGRVAVVSSNGIRTRRYWDFDPRHQVRFTSFLEYAGAFRHYFDQAVRRRLRSAGPVAVSVSGGLDSSAVYCAAETLRRSAPDRYPQLLGTSYTAPDGAAWDEKAFLLDIERTYGVEIHRCKDLPGGFADRAREAVFHTEAPYLEGQWSGTTAYLSTVRGLGARVLLSGHWGDQFLADDAYLVDLARSGRWLQARSDLAACAEWSAGLSPRHFQGRLLRGLVRSILPNALVPPLRAVRATLRASTDTPPWYTTRFQQRAAACRAKSGFPADGFGAHARSLYRAARCRYHVFCMEWNNKVGAMHGIEMAFPFLDRDLIAFLIATPGDMHNFEGIPKRILREALRGVLPDAIADRRTKADFTAVVNNGIAGDYEWMLDRLRRDGAAYRQGYVEDDAAEEVARPCVPDGLARAGGAVEVGDKGVHAGAGRLGGFSRREVLEASSPGFVHRGTLRRVTRLTLCDTAQPRRWRQPHTRMAGEAPMNSSDQKLRVTKGRPG